MIKTETPHEETTDGHGGSEVDRCAKCADRRFNSKDPRSKLRGIKEGGAGLSLTALIGAAYAQLGPLRTDGPYPR